MAWGRKKSGGRREPQFGLGASLAELRLTPQDRINNAEASPKKSSPRRKPDESDDESPRERKRAPVSRDRGRRKSSRRARPSVFRLFYWGAVLGLWAVIALAGV